MKKRIEIGDDWIEVELNDPQNVTSGVSLRYGSGSITSNLKVENETFGDSCFNSSIDGLESLVLAHACSGVDITSVAYVEGIKTALEAIGNNY